MKKHEILISVIVIILFIALVVYLQRSHRAIPPTSETASITNQQTNGTMASETTTASGLKITVLKEGSGVASVNGDTAYLNYTGTFTDGKAFDSNVDPKFGHTQPLPVTLGAHSVIPGWEEGVLGMKVGEKRHLVIPANLAYGANGYGPIPGGATIEFDVELVSISHK